MQKSFLNKILEHNLVNIISIEPNDRDSIKSLSNFSLLQVNYVMKNNQASWPVQSCAKFHQPFFHARWLHINAKWDPIWKCPTFFLWWKSLRTKRPANKEAFSRSLLLNIWMSASIISSLLSMKFLNRIGHFKKRGLKISSWPAKISFT